MENPEFSEPHLCCTRAQTLQHTSHAAGARTFSDAACHLFRVHDSQEGFEGQMTETNIEIGVVDAAGGFRRLAAAEVKDYLSSVAL